MRAPGVLQTSIIEFLGALYAERGLRLNTRLAYQNDLCRLDSFLTELGIDSLHEITEAHLLDFAAAEQNRGLKDSSRARALVSVRQLFRFIRNEGHIGSNPAERLGVPARGHRIPRVLTLSEIWRVLGGIRPGEPLATRDRALLEFLYATGVRASEATKLDLSQVTQLSDPENEGQPREDGVAGIALVDGKGGHQRLVPISTRAMEHYERWVVEARPQLLVSQSSAGLDDPGIAFLTRRGKRLRREDVFRIVQRAMRSAGVTTDASPHVLRHTFATHLLENGAEIRMVQELLGHARVTTTQIYTHVNRRRLRKTMDSFHPRSG